MPLHPLVRGDSGKAPLGTLQKFSSIFGDILMQIWEETASNLRKPNPLPDQNLGQLLSPWRL